LSKGLTSHLTQTGIVVHNWAQNSSDDLPYIPPDNHCSDVIYWRGAEFIMWWLPTQHGG